MAQGRHRPTAPFCPSQDLGPSYIQLHAFNSQALQLYLRAQCIPLSQDQMKLKCSMGISALPLDRSKTGSGTPIYRPHCVLENYDIGNPDGRIPENIPARHRDTEMITEAGNPDIWVPDSVKMANGLRALRTLKTRDADVGGTEGGERKETVHEETPTEEKITTGPEDTATGQEGPKEL
ncbi:hypothetical protein NDU88_005900 [Pleurodeles waltl]|uniref:Uncharacterized protein n=1 Tax=Pleurodeles waltl TaxID=8319 RepID=A0AAV7NWL0_PLEWA|nr:hypothetical protein NDU88_005900 [Pleurodeles waltl]